MQMFDSLRNVVANLGTARDKGGQAEYVPGVHNRQQLWAAYQASSLVQRVIDLPAEDACREWREWQAESADISAIEATEARLGVQGKVLEASRLARLYGGSAILIVTNEKDMAKPLNPASLGKDGVKYLTVLSDTDLSAGEQELDPRKPWFGSPKEWSLAVGNEITPTIHPSRLVVFHGIQPMADRQNTNVGGWGDSALAGMIDAVKRVDEVAGNILSLVYEAKIDVIKIPDLMGQLERGGTKFEQQLLHRLTLAATAKGINGAMILDEKEAYEQKSASFGSLDNIADRMMQLASAASGIPMTLLFGMSPGGLNATGDADTRGYYDRVKVHQTLKMQPAMGVLDECLIRSALGSRPADVYYNWRPLWQPTAKERAETGKTLSETMKNAVEIDAVSVEAGGKALINALTESGAFPGLESAAEEFPVDEDDFGADDVGITDAKPQTLYVSRKLLNAKDVIRWAKAQGFKTTLPEDDMHVTIAFSRNPVDWMDVGESWTSRLELGAGGPRQMEQFGEARVLLFASDELKWRHERIKDAGASWDHPEYQPHVTISYDPDAPDIADIEPYTGPLIFGPEVFAEIKEDWAERITEE